MEVRELEDPTHGDGTEWEGGRLVRGDVVQVRNVQTPVGLSRGPASAGGAEDHSADVSAGESVLRGGGAS